MKRLLFVYLFVLCFASIYSYAQQQYQVTVEQKVNQSELWIDFYITLTGAGPLYLGMSNFSIFVTASNLDVAAVSLDQTTKGPWDALTDGANYNLMSFGSNAVNGYVNLTVLSNTGGPGPGQPVTTTPTRIGRLKIPITNPAGFNTVSWRLNPMGVYNFANQNIKSQGSFINPAPNFPLCSIPNIPILTANQMQIPPGGSVTLISSYHGICNWYFDGTLIPNQHSDTLLATQAGFYTAKATYYSCESDFSDSLTLTPMQICNLDSSFTGNFTACQNQLAQYQANASALDYNWVVSGGTIVGANNTQIVTIDWDTLPNATLSLTVSDSHCAAISIQNIILQGDNPDPTLFLNPQNQLQTTESSNVQWYFNGTLINGANQDTLTPTLPGDYFVITGNNCDTDTSNTITYLPTNIQNVLPFTAYIYPNPFFDQTSLYIELTSPQFVTISLYNPVGQLVQEIAQDYYTGGKHQFRIDAEKIQLTVGTFWLKLKIYDTEQNFPIIFTRK